MAIEFAVASNIKQVQAMLTQTQREQIPFAAVVAMTRTAQAVRDVQLTEMRRVFDRPTPYTMNSLFVQPATKRRPQAAVGFKEFAGKGTPAWKYLGPRRSRVGRVGTSAWRSCCRPGVCCACMSCPALLPTWTSTAT